MTAPDPSPPTVLTEEELATLRDGRLSLAEAGGRVVADRVAAAVQEERAAIVAGIADDAVALADLLDAVRAKIYNGAPDPWQAIYDEGCAPLIEVIALYLRESAARGAS